jgi:hypothetical protein
MISRDTIYNKVWIVYRGHGHLVRNALDAIGDLLNPGLAPLISITSSGMNEAPDDRA